jgi:membrane protein DedA with SNARE-associated domain
MQDLTTRGGRAPSAAPVPWSPVNLVLLSAQTASDAPLTGIAAWAVGVMETLGGFGAALLIALENLFPPLPSEVILPLAGFTASQGSLGLVEVIIWCTGGSVVGAWVLYGIGALLGRDRTRAIMNWLPLVKIEDVDKTEGWFHKHGKGTVFLGRMIPIFRSLISIPAGITRMPILLFTALTLAGSLIWNTVLIVAGYALGENWHIVEEYVGTFSRVVIVVVILLLAWFVISRVRALRVERRAGHESGGTGENDPA